MDYLTSEGQQPANCKVIDTRMGAETYQIWDATTQAWTDNWFSDSESLPEACNARGTPWCATMCITAAFTGHSNCVVKRSLCRSSTICRPTTRCP